MADLAEAGGDKEPGNLTKEVGQDTVGNGEEPRRGERKRVLTDKAKRNKIEQLSSEYWKAQRNFNRLKRGVQVMLGEYSTPQRLKEIIDDIEEDYRSILDLYENLREVSEAAPEQEIRKSIDQLKVDKDQLQAEATRRLIDMEDGGSHRSSLSRRSKSSLRSRNFGRSSISSKAMDAEAEAAAYRAELAAQREEVIKQEELRQLELEMERKREELNRTHTEKCLRIAEAKAKNLIERTGNLTQS